MASVTVTLTDICSGGNHLTFGVTGARTATVPGTREEFVEGGPISDEDMAIFIKCLCRLARAGRTMAQARNVLQAGVTVTV